MIKLSKRLQKIAELINEEDTVLDIGCDHALLDIYLSNKYNKTYNALHSNLLFKIINKYSNIFTVLFDDFLKHTPQLQ